MRLGHRTLTDDWSIRGGSGSRETNVDIRRDACRMKCTFAQIRAYVRARTRIIPSPHADRHARRLSSRKTTRPNSTTNACVTDNSCCIIFCQQIIDAPNICNID